MTSQPTCIYYQLHVLSIHIHVFTYQATIYIDSSVGSTVRTSSLKRTRILISKNIKLCLHLCGLVFFFAALLAWRTVKSGRQVRRWPKIQCHTFARKATKSVGHFPILLVGSFVGTLRVVPVVVRSECPKQR